MPASDMVAERLSAQLLAGPPAASPVAVAERLLAIQAQDGRGARLAIRSRTSGLHARDVDRALTDDRSLLITWLNRGTLHLVRREDYPWLQALTAPTSVTANAKRLLDEGVPPADAHRAIATIEGALAEEGPLTRRQLREHVDRIGVRTAGQAMVHILMRASLQGRIVRGPVVGSEQAFVLVADWLGETPPIDREQALAELARRYLAGHGPADDRDLSKWAGLPLRDTRAGLAAIAAELVQRPDGLVDLARREPAAPLPAPRLLGAFDPTLHGWASREFITGAQSGIVTSNGLFRPYAMVRGKAVATWRLAGGEVGIEPFAPLSRPVAAALRVDADEVIRFLH